jgi:Porin PorA
VRRAISLVLLTLGIFGVAMGLLLRFYAYPKLAVSPLDPHAKTVAQGTATVFDPGTFKQRDDVALTATRRIDGKIDSPEVKINGSVAVWEMGLVTEDDSGGLVDAQDQWVCVDRRNAQAAQPCTDEKLNGDASLKATGLQYKFPFHTQKHDYSFYDVFMHQAPPMHYDGEEVIDGLPVYRFVQTIPVTKIADIPDTPSSLVGGTANDPVTAGRMYENVRTVWVEPYTGSIVKGQEKVHQFLRGPDGTDGQVLLDGTLTFTADTIRDQVAEAKKNRAKVQLLYQTGPLVLIGLGVLFLLAGLVVLLLSTDRFRMPNRRPAQVRPEMAETA